MARVKRVPLGAIEVTGKALTTQVRVATDAAIVEQYEKDIRKGDKFPPVDLIADGGGRYYIADGWHRVLAHVAADKEVINAYVHGAAKGLDALATAQRHALGANSSHGVRLNPADQRRKAELAVLHPAMAHLSDRKTADAIGVGHQTVSRARADAVRAGKIPHRLAGCYFDDYCPPAYAALQEYRSAFGTDGALFSEIRAYVRQLDAAHPAEWSYSQESGLVTHRGMQGGAPIAFSIEGNPVRNGKPSRWERPEDDYLAQPVGKSLPTDAQRAMWERQAIERAAAKLPPRVRRAALALQAYCDDMGLHEQVAAIIRLNAPAPEYAECEF